MSPYAGAEEFLPRRMNVKALREAAAECRGCDLYQNATQTVFGEGRRKATVMLLGEMPGDQEDKQGHPFVGPAGRLLSDVIAEAGLSRNQVYITNAVKHFRWEPRGQRRLHKKPTARQLEACKPWLHAEILVVEPRVIVCLGATAAQTMLGREFRLTRHRGEFFKNANGIWLTATYHPSAILRAPEKSDRDRMRALCIDDLQHAAEHLQGVDL